MSGKKLLLINGSPRKKGTSYSFARTIKLLAENCGNEAEIISMARKR
jgi:multimeric flavodoxin WrbA